MTRGTVEVTVLRPLMYCGQRREVNEVLAVPPADAWLLCSGGRAKLRDERRDAQTVKAAVQAETDCGAEGRGPAPGSAPAGRAMAASLGSYVLVKLRIGAGIVHADGRLLSRWGLHGNLYALPLREALRLIDRGKAKLPAHMSLRGLRDRLARAEFKPLEAGPGDSLLRAPGGEA